MQEGCEALGWSFAQITRNSDPSVYAPESAAYIGFGDQSGSKQSADRTWLADAQAAGAKLLAHTRVQRILVEGGRAAGVEAQLGDARRPGRRGDGPRAAAWWSPRARSSRRRCCCAPGSAARRSGRTSASIPAPP